MDNAEFFVKYVVQQIVSEPERVVVERGAGDQGTVFSVSVAPDDMGGVIGKNGSTAQAIRVLLRAVSRRDNIHYTLKIIDTNPLNQEAE